MTGENSFAALLRDRLEIQIDRIEPLEGGMIGTVARVHGTDGTCVVAKTGPTPLETEAFMLGHLADESDLPVPSVEYAARELLVLEDLPGTTDHGHGVARDAARHLGALHDVTGRAHGFPRDTVTGPVHQPNPWTDSWRSFFRKRRLEHAAQLALEEPSPIEESSETGALPPSLYERLRTIATDTDVLLEEPPAPSLIHGDVWRTNVLSEDGRVTGFLDPASYYADPEIELAYVDWTDTFGEAFFQTYESLRGIREGFFETRRYVYRLYPLLVHVHLFGEDYLAELERTCAKLGY